MSDEVSNFGRILSFKCQLVADLKAFLAVRPFLGFALKLHTQKVLHCECNGLYFKM